MIEFIRDPFWQFFGVLTAFLLFFLQFYYTRKSRKMYALVSKPVSIIKRPNFVGSKFEIKYGEKLVTDLRLVTVKIGNSGNLPIQSADFEKAIVITFCADGQIDKTSPMEVIIISSDPAQIPIETELNSHSVTVKPILLNPSDSFTLGILGEEIEVENITARIAGVKSIRLSDRIENDYPSAQYFLIRVWFSLTFISYMVLIFFGRYTGKSSPMDLFTQVALFLFTILLSTGGTVILLSFLTRSIFEAKK